MSATEPLVKISNLKIDGIADETRTRIINNVSLDLNRGEVMGLIGESGAGKSTLGLAAMGFTRDGCEIVGGNIMFDGIDLITATPDVKRQLLGKRIAYVAQSAAASFNPAHKIINQHAEAPLCHGVSSRTEAEADAIDLYERLRLPNPDEIGFRYPHQVSGGQLQRAMTAMAMSCRPDLIIFDEPTTALDVTTQIEVLSPSARCPAIPDRRNLYHPRPCGCRADGRPGESSSAWRRGGRSRHAHPCWKPHARTTQSRSGRFAASSGHKNRLPGKARCLSSAFAT